MTRQLVIAGIGEVLWDVYPDAARFGGAPANFACHARAQNIGQKAAEREAPSGVSEPVLSQEIRTMRQVR